MRFRRWVDLSLVVLIGFAHSAHSWECSDVFESVHGASGGSAQSQEATQHFLAILQRIVALGPQPLGEPSVAVSEIQRDIHLAASSGSAFYLGQVSNRADVIQIWDQFLRTFRRQRDSDLARASADLVRLGLLRLNKEVPWLTPFNNVLFERPHMSEAERRRNLKNLGFDSEEFYSDSRSVFKDGLIYHGTTAASAARIRNAGPVFGYGYHGRGFYGVSREGLLVANEYANPEPSSTSLFLRFWTWYKTVFLVSKNVVRIPVLSTAKIVDIRSGLGKIAFDRFESSPALDVRFAGTHLQEFAAYVDADIIVCGYASGTQAVVYNSGILGHAVRLPE